MWGRLGLQRSHFELAPGGGGPLDPTTEARMELWRSKWSIGPIRRSEPGVQQERAASGSVLFFVDAVVTQSRKETKAHHPRLGLVA